MEIQGSAVFIPLEYIPFCCVGFIFVVAVGWGIIKIIQSLAPRKETIYYRQDF